MDFINWLADNGIDILRSSDIQAGTDNKLIKDKWRKDTIYYSLSDCGMFGRVYDCRTDRELKYVSGAFKKLDPSEKSKRMAEQAQRLIEQKRLDIELQKAAIETGKAYVESLDNAVKSKYFDKKNLPIPEGAKQEQDGVIIPFNDIKGAFCGYQILADDGGKYFMPRSRIKGAFYKIQGIDNDVILICEGVATGQTINRATGYSVYVAFNAGNIQPAGQALRGEHVGLPIIICADNDQWSAKSHFKGYDKTLSGDAPEWKEWRDKGLLYNTGIIKANEAAADLNAHVCYPDIPDNDPDKRTDFNDIGEDETARIVLGVINAVKNHVERDKFEGEIEVINDKSEVITFDPTKGDRGMPFRVMGYQEDIRVYYSYLEKQVVCLKPSEHNYANFLRLAKWENWQSVYNPTGQNIQDSSIIKTAISDLTAIAQERGPFDFNKRVRGAGCWVDGKKRVLNTGEKIILDGDIKELYEVRSNNIYVISASKFTPATDPLSNKEANALRELCALCPWERPINGDLLAGAIVAGQVCAALRWRPIVWISGQKGTGKSTILQKLLKPALGDIALHFTRGTTEAGIRQRMKYDARPVIYDEAEPSSTMESVMSLAKSSTGDDGASIGKYGQGDIDPKSMFFFSSTDIFAKDLSEESRMVILRLKQPRGIDRSEKFEAFQRKADDVLKNNFSGRLLKRTHDNLDTFLANIQVFTKALNKILKDSRSADQIAPLMAGAYLLTTLKEIDFKTALEISERHDWGNYTTAFDDPDHQRLLDKIMSSMVFHGKEKVAIGDLLKEVFEYDNKLCLNTLKNYGISYAEGKVLIANKHENLKSLLVGTQWAHSWSRTLGDFEEAESVSLANFAGGVKSRAVKLPIKLVLGDDKVI